MKKSVFLVVGGVLSCLFLTSCSNNALEEIIGEVDNPGAFVSALAPALEKDAVVTVGLIETVQTTSKEVQYEFKNDGEKFVIQAIYVDGVQSDLTPEQLETVAAAKYKLSYDETNNLVKFLISFPHVAGSSTRVVALLEAPVCAINFDLSNDMYSQYNYLCYEMGPYYRPYYYTIKSIKVKGNEVFDLLTPVYTKKAILNGYMVPGDGKLLEVCYNEGETWDDVNKRYIEEVGTALYIDKTTYLEFVSGTDFALEYMVGHTSVKKTEEVGKNAGGSDNPDGYHLGT